MASTLDNLAYDKGSGSATGTFKDGTSHSSSITNATQTDYIDISSVVRGAFQVVNGITNAFTFTVEGSIDGTNFSTIAYGTGSSAAYTQAAATVAAAAKGIFFLPDADVIRYIRLNPSAANSNGTTVSFFGRLA